MSDRKELFIKDEEISEQLNGNTIDTQLDKILSIFHKDKQRMNSVNYKNSSKLNLSTTQYLKIENSF